MSWRTCPFQKGREYRIRKTFRSLQFEFEMDRLVRYVDEGYSRYDSVTIYHFEDTATGANLQWWLPDEGDQQEWDALFEPCG